MDPQPGITNKAIPFPMSLQPNRYKPVRNGGAAPSLQPRLASDAENTTSQPQTPECHTRSCMGDMPISNNKLKEQELTVEGGRINISTVYSQRWVIVHLLFGFLWLLYLLTGFFMVEWNRLLKTLTQALQSSGVDLSQASVAVQIDLGKRATQAPITLASNLKVHLTLHFVLIWSASCIILYQINACWREMKFRLAIKEPLVLETEMEVRAQIKH